MHAIEELFALLDQFGSYPNGVMKIPGRLDGTAFFPGGLGLWNTQPHELPPPVPIGGSLVIGHNFDSEAGFQRSFHHAGENLKSATWRNKVPRNHAVGIACSEYHETGAACAVEVSIENNRPLLQELERLRHIQRRPYDSQKPDTI